MKRRIRKNSALDELFTFQDEYEIDPRILVQARAELEALLAALDAGDPEAIEAAAEVKEMCLRNLNRRDQ